jgi:hypothetical protein
MNKEQFERALDATSIKPVYRTKINGQELFIADGYVSPPQLKYLSSFGVSATPEEYPSGCYATIWYSPRQIAGRCGTCVFDAMHDGGRSLEARLSMRIRTAVEKAAQDMRKSTIH